MKPSAASARSRPVAEDDALRLERIDSLEDARDDWARLAEDAGNVFLTWEWMAGWWKHFGAGEEPLVFVCRDRAGRAIAILPFAVIERGPLVIARFMGHGPADELGPVCAPADRARVAGAIQLALREAGGDLFLGEQLPGDADWSAWLGGSVVRREASPTIYSPDTGWEGYLKQKSANFREQVRARERRLRQHHEVTYRLASDPERLQSDLDVLFQLHRARWGDEMTSFRSEPFHREFAAAALSRGWLRLWFLELDGHPAAAWYGFRFSDVEAFYQSGRDPHLGRASVGFVLLAHTIREALDEGAREYRLLRGDEPYKYRFAHADRGVLTVAHGRGLLGKAAVTAGITRHGLARLRRRVLFRSHSSPPHGYENAATKRDEQS
jgi:CelD/BcsL family acetyltransferase involved in cellulose biosynthesis